MSSKYIIYIARQKESDRGKGENLITLLEMVTTSFRFWEL